MTRRWDLKGARATVQSAAGGAAIEEATPPNLKPYATVQDVNRGEGGGGGGSEDHGRATQRYCSNSTTRVLITFFPTPVPSFPGIGFKRKKLTVNCVSW